MEDTKAKRILLAEDSLSLRQLISFGLKKHGFVVDVCKNGLESIALIKEHPPDLIITDVMMPEMDGFTLTKIIKSTPEYKNIPIIILTATASNIKSKIEGVKYGADKYLYKPFKLPVLLQVIDDLLGKTREKIKVAVKSENMYLFGFKNEKQYFDDITDIIAELTETRAFIKDEVRNWKDFFTELRDAFFDNFKDKIEEFKLGYFIDKEKIIIKIQWDDTDLFKDIDSDSIFSFIKNYAEAYKINKNELTIKKDLTSPDNLLDELSRDLDFN